MFSTQCQLTNIPTDLSAAVDVYSDWIDACDSVAQEAAGTSRESDAPHSYQDLTAGPGGRRNSEFQNDRHLVPVAGDDDDQGNYDDED